jgi:hypothetical protein
MNKKFLPCKQISNLNKRADSLLKNGEHVHVKRLNSSHGVDLKSKHLSINVLENTPEFKRFIKIFLTNFNIL